MTDAIRLLSIRDNPLSVGEVYDAVNDREAGGIALFVGTVRDHDSGKEVVALDYSAHPTAADALRQVVVDVVKQFDVIAVAAVHRVGKLVIGDIAVITAVSCVHRGEAFSASRRLIDDLKAQVPIWKHQTFTDGAEEWVGTP